MTFYEEIYNQGINTCWINLDRKIQEVAIKRGLKYVFDDDNKSLCPDDKPVVVNYFYHEKIKKTAIRKAHID